MFNLVTASFGVFSRAVQKILGGQLLSDLSGFVAALDTTFGGFRERAERTYRILQAPETAFLVVAVPEPDAIREAGYFAGRLRPRPDAAAGLVLNRTHRSGAPGLTAAGRARRSGRARRGRRHHGATADALRIHAALTEQVARETRRSRRRSPAQHPDVPVVAVAAQPADVHDIDGLRDDWRRVGR